MQEFGNEWTKSKIEILEKYTLAYLQIMKSRKYFELIYFDGFAGTGEIQIEKEKVEGAAKKILSIEKPRKFDMYYFVELDTEKAQLLEDLVNKDFEEKKDSIFINSSDCNKKLLDLATYLKKPENKMCRVLAFIDPKGMQVLYQSLEAFKDIQGVDLWILLPTGIGTNRLLTKKGKLKQEWVKRLNMHLGISKKEIQNRFYKTQGDLFNPEGKLVKEEKAISTIIALYKEKLNNIWDYVSNPYAMKNNKNSTMFHFLLASNNSKAIDIANDIIRKYNS